MLSVPLCSVSISGTYMFICMQHSRMLLSNQLESLSCGAIEPHQTLMRFACVICVHNRMSGSPFMPAAQVLAVCTNGHSQRTTGSQDCNPGQQLAKCHMVIAETEQHVLCQLHTGRTPAVCEHYWHSYDSHSQSRHVPPPILCSKPRSSRRSASSSTAHFRAWERKEDVFCR